MRLQVLTHRKKWELEETKVGWDWGGDGHSSRTAERGDKQTPPACSEGPKTSKSKVLDHLEHGETSYSRRSAFTAQNQAF